jgi:hypothetical protein
VGHPIVVGTDGSNMSSLAIEEAGVLAQFYARRVIVVFVHEHLLAGFIDTFVPGGNIPVESVQEAQEVIAFAQCVTILDPLGIKWEFRVRRGRTAAELIKAAVECSARAIVVVERGRISRRRFHPFSVSGKLLARWPYSLLILSTVGSSCDARSTCRIQGGCRDGSWFNPQMF